MSKKWTGLILIFDKVSSAILCTTYIFRTFSNVNTMCPFVNCERLARQGDYISCTATGKGLNLRWRYDGVCRVPQHFNTMTHVKATVLSSEYKDINNKALFWKPSIFFFPWVSTGMYIITTALTTRPSDIKHCIAQQETNLSTWSVVTKCHGYMKGCEHISHTWEFYSVCGLG